MTQTNPLPGIALQWKAVGPFNQAPQATVSIQLHAPFGDAVAPVLFPATNATYSNSGSFFPAPLIGVFDSSGRLVGPDGYPLVVPALDWNPWLNAPTFYEVQIDIEGLSGKRGIFVAFSATSNNFDDGLTGVLLCDTNASTSAMTGSGDTYTGTLYLGDTVVSPVLVNQTVAIGPFTAVVNSIDLPTNSAAVTTTEAQDANANVALWWGGEDTNLAVDLSQYVNWL